MELKLDELWMEAVELQVDQLVVGYLRKSHADYQNMQKRQWQLLEQYPVLSELIDSADEIKLNKEEHRALREFIQIQDGMQRLEKEYSYYYGQSNVFSYGKMLKTLNHEMNPDGNVALKKKLMDMIVEERTCEAELEYLKTDKEYQQCRQEASRQEKIFLDMNPPKEIMEQVDNITSAIHNYWSRYSDLIYQTAVNDILAFLTEN